MRALKYIPEVYASLVTGDLKPAHAVDSTDKQLAFIQELERKKEFEIKKDDVKELRMVRPGLITNGLFIITKTSGDKITIRVRGQKAWHMIIDLMDRFYPQAVKIQ